MRVLNSRDEGVIGHVDTVVCLTMRVRATVAVGGRVGVRVGVEVGARVRMRDSLA